jgi:hypothetical protein
MVISMPHLNHTETDNNKEGTTMNDALQAAIKEAKSKPLTKSEAELTRAIHLFDLIYAKIEPNLYPVIAQLERGVVLLGAAKTKAGAAKSAVGRYAFENIAFGTVEYKGGTRDIWLLFP